MGAEPPVYHVVVVGFHHKKGCQVNDISNILNTKD